MIPQSHSGIAIRNRHSADLPSGSGPVGSARPLPSAFARRLLPCTRPGSPRSRLPEPPARRAGRLRLADPALTIELVAAEPRGGQPGRDRLGRGRAALRRRDDRLSGRPDRRDGSGGWRTATATAVTSTPPSSPTGLPFPNGVLPCFGGVLVTAAPDIWFFRDNDGDGRADERKVVLTGFGEGNTQLRVNGLVLGPGQLDLRGQRPERRRGPHAGRAARPRPSRSAAATCDSGSGPSHARIVRGRGRSPASASSAWPTTTGATASPRGTRSRSATSCSSSRPRPQPLPGRDLVGRLDPRPGRRRPDLPDQPAAGPVQSRVGRLLQRQLRPDDLPRRPACRPPTAATPSSASR